MAAKTTKTPKPDRLDDRLAVDEREAARLISMSVAYLRAARRGDDSRASAPPHFKIGRRIRYDVEALKNWLAAKSKGPA